MAVSAPNCRLILPKRRRSLPGHTTLPSGILIRVHGTRHLSKNLLTRMLFRSRLCISILPSDAARWQKSFTGCERECRSRRRRLSKWQNVLLPGGVRRPLKAFLTRAIPVGHARTQPIRHFGRLIARGKWSRRVHLAAWPASAERPIVSRQIVRISAPMAFGTSMEGALVWGVGTYRASVSTVVTAITAGAHLSPLQTRILVRI
jgi:hypothetical protein